MALHHEDFFQGVHRIAEGSVDLAIADPPYGLGKDWRQRLRPSIGRGHSSSARRWIDGGARCLRANASLYVFLTWQHSPEVFSYIKTRLIMLNEIIWDRRVPSMGGSTRKYSSVHDNIGFFVKSRDYY